MSEREILELDVVFVGAGPANLAAAYHLAKLVERHNARAAFAAIYFGPMTRVL